MSGRHGSRAHFIALRTFDGRPALAGGHAARFLDALADFRERDGFRLHAYIVLPARVGLVVAMPDRQVASARALLARLAARHARTLHDGSGWPGRIFQDEVAVVGVETAAAIARRAAALHRLPVQASLARRPSAWPWSSAPAWIGFGIPPVPVDLPEEAVEEARASARSPLRIIR
jgi:hypothetical protein